MSPGMVIILFSLGGDLSRWSWQSALGSESVPTAWIFYSVCDCHGVQGIHLILTVRASLILLAFRRQIGRGLLGVKCHYFITLTSNK